MHRPLPEHRSPRCDRAPRGRRRDRNDARLVLCVSAGLLAAMMAARPAIADGVNSPARAPDGAGASDARAGGADRAKTPRHSGPTWLRGHSAETRSSPADGWWSGMAFLALVGVVGGGILLTTRRLGPRGTAGAVQVVGRVSLSSKHSVYVLRVGRRVLVVGAGPQGPPALLTELDDVTEDPPARHTEAES